MSSYAQWWQASQPKGQNPTAGIFLVDSTRWYIRKDVVDDLIAADRQPDTYLKDAGQDLPAWIVEEPVYYTTVASKNPQRCVYDAAKKYLELTGKGGFTHGDQKYFDDHPNVDYDGVKRQHVLGVVAGLIRPWGLGISRVYVPRGTANFAELSIMKRALGCNPQAEMNSSTSNEDLATALTSDGEGDYSEILAMLDKSFGVIFTDSPRRPCIVMLSKKTQAIVKTNVQGVWSESSSGGAWGHAEVIGPRDTLPAGDWYIAIEIERDDSFAYIDPSAIDELISQSEGSEHPSNETKTLSTWASVLRGGFTYNEVRDKNKKPVKSLAPAKKGATPVAKTPVAQQMALVVSGNDEKCIHCGGINVDQRTYGTGEAWYFCYDCFSWWFDDEIDDEDEIETAGELCPFCGQETVFDREGNEVCDSCLFDGSIFHQSSQLQCSHHMVPLYWFYKNHIIEDESDKDNPYRPEDMKYMCPECMAEIGIGAFDIYSIGDRKELDEIKLVKYLMGKIQEEAIA